MNASELLTRVRLVVLGGSRRPPLGRTCILMALFALVVLSSCGRSARTTSSGTESGSANESAIIDQSPEGGIAGGVENEAQDHDVENPDAADAAWLESAAAGEFEAEYRAGETEVTTAAGQTVILVGAGDIASSGSGDTKTAELLDRIAGTVFTTGDNAYSGGTASEFSKYYAPTWGRHKARTRPTPGNHDYEASGAKPYYSYFGANAGPSGRGYYSYNAGDWHIVSLNSNISMSSSSAQYKWLKADLEANRNACTLAYWHHPRFSSGDHGNSTKSKAIYQLLYDKGAEVVVVGHDHNYERFAPQTADGKKDLARGIRQFVVGTGGKSLRSMGSSANTEARNSSTHGVVKFTLAPGSYQWEFIPVAGKTYRDAGSGTCQN